MMVPLAEPPTPEGSPSPLCLGLALLEGVGDQEDIRRPVAWGSRLD